MFLHLSLQANKIKLTFFDEKKILYSEEREIKSDKLLLWFDQVLKKKKLKTKDIVSVVLGPVREATFSASRGITNFVNILGFSLGAPVARTSFSANETNRQKIIRLVKKSKVGRASPKLLAKAGTILIPEYSGEPNITSA